MNKQPNPKIKILVAYHMPCRLLKDEVFTPIHVGREIAGTCSKDGLATQDTLDWMKDNMIGDNEGENISDQNRYLNELTAVYWAWKNDERLGNPDYIGFMHARRHLCFDLQNSELPDRVGLLYADRLDNEYIKKFCLNASEVTSVVKHYDIVLAERCDLERLGTSTCYNHYLSSSPSLHIVDYDRVLKILIDKHPDYKDSVSEYNASRYAYFTNIFIMRRELFREYAEWLFPIIFESYEHLDIAHYNISEARANAMISEWLFGIWYTHLRRVRDIRALELKRTLVRDTSIDIRQHLSPAFHTNNIALCLCADSLFIPYLAVSLRSIIENASPLNNYDIVILHENIPLSLQHQILGMKEANVSIRFVCVDAHMRNYQDGIFGTRPHITKATYYRFFIPQIFEQYEKVLYLDCDLVVNRDVANLYHTVLDENYLVGAVRDCEIIRWANKDKAWGRSYFNDFLHIKDVFDYFQAGVILFNVVQCEAEKVVEKLFSALNHYKKLKFSDQDVLNIVCEGRALFLDLRWNVEYHIPIWSPDWMQTMPVGILNDYIASREEPWILHFAGSKKPWQNPSLEMSEYFWKYAKRTPFYEEILHASIKDATGKALKHQVTTMQDAVARQIRGDMDKALKHQVTVIQEVVTKKMRSDMDVFSKRQVNMIQDVLMLPIYRRKLKRIRIRSHLSWGARKQRYLQRKHELKAKVRAIERMIKDFRKSV